MTDDHPGRGRILAYQDGELPSGDRREVEEHLDGCARCRRVAERHREWSRALSETARLVDVRQPDLDLPAPGDAGGARAGASSADELDVVPIGSVQRSSLVRAAAVLVTLGVGALAVTSGPVRAFAGNLIEGLSSLFGGGDSSRPAAQVATDTAGRTEVAPASAASIQARDGRVRIDIRTGPGDRTPVVRVRFRPMTTAVVEAEGAVFETGPGRLVVNASESDTLLVELPESVREATVRVNGRSLIRTRGGEVIHGLPPDTANGDLLYRPGR